MGFVVSHLRARHPTDEDLSVGTPGRREDGARKIFYDKDGGLAPLRGVAS